MLRLRGPTGVIIHDGWYHAYFAGIPLCGMRIEIGVALGQKGLEWMLANVAHNWSPRVAELVNHGDFYVYDLRYPRRPEGP